MKDRFDCLLAAYLSIFQWWRFLHFLRHNGPKFVLIRILGKGHKEKITYYKVVVPFSLWS